MGNFALQNAASDVYGVVSAGDRYSFDWKMVKWNSNIKDSKLGKIASTVMGSTETTIYTIAIYTSSIKVKKTRYILLAALCADIVGIITSVIVCNLMF